MLHFLTTICNIQLPVLAGYLHISSCHILLWSQFLRYHGVSGWVIGEWCLLKEFERDILVIIEALASALAWMDWEKSWKMKIAAVPIEIESHNFPKVSLLPHQYVRFHRVFVRYKNECIRNIQYNLWSWPPILVGYLAQLATLLLKRQIYMVLYVVIIR